MNLSLRLDQAGDFSRLGPHSPVSVDVAYVRASGNPYLASPYFGAWPGGGSATSGVVVTVRIGDVVPIGTTCGMLQREVSSQ